jgi:hypothetical protein
MNAGLARWKREMNGSRQSSAGSFFIAPIDLLALEKMRGRIAGNIVPFR